jgi:hypothetical protein
MKDFHILIIKTGVATLIILVITWWIVIAANSIVNAFVIFGKKYEIEYSYKLTEEEIERIETAKFNEQLRRYFEDHKNCCYYTEWRCEDE